MTATRTIQSVNVSVTRDGMGDMDLGDYLVRLEAAIRAMPGVTEDTEIDVMEGDVTKYEGLYTDSEFWQYDALSDRLMAVAEGVFSQMCRGKSA
jgi:hypothetical protein